MQIFGLAFAFQELRRVEVPLLIDKMANRLPTWQGKFLNRAGRLKKVDKIRRGILWKGSEAVSGGHCLVRWANVQKPKELRGPGVLDLEHFSRALRLQLSKWQN
jgi:hypothetical protein